MDDLIALCEATEVSHTSWADSNKAPRLAQWKEKKLKMGDQRKRRQLCLENQKTKRAKLIDEARSIEDEDDSKENFEIKASKNCDEQQTRRKKDVKVFDEFRDKLMQSEWLVDIPNDFNEWSLKIVPFGKRRLLDAQFGRTTLYDKRGKQTNRYWSGLPGGNKHSPNTQTLLDGIYDEFSKTFFILDVLLWNGYDYTECETDFRFYWLKEKYAELKHKGSINIELLEAHSLENFKEVFSGDPNEIIGEGFIDGFLFYHNAVHYYSGVTPLVGWLKPDMISEQFNITPHHNYLRQIQNDKRVQFPVPEKLQNKSMLE